MMSSCEGVDFINNEDVVWQYCPTFAPAVLFAVLFFLTTGSHIIQAFRFKKVNKILSFLSHQSCKRN